MARETKKSCWGCGPDFRTRWSAMELATVELNGEEETVCPDCYEELVAEGTLEAL